MILNLTRILLEMSLKDFIDDSYYYFFFQYTLLSKVFTICHFLALVTCCQLGNYAFPLMYEKEHYFYMDV